MYRVPDSDSDSTDSNLLRVTGSENELKDEDRSVNSENSSSDYETCDSQEYHTMSDHTMSDQNMTDHTFPPVEQQDAPQAPPEQPGQQQPGLTNIPNITAAQYQALREMIIAEIANQQTPPS
ncbi:hypothetical protein K3495_g66 [Podosphaera aphanis]|nr:hypothetical protein K3495_g66 [Podosphaera aphanis]